MTDREVFESWMKSENPGTNFQKSDGRYLYTAASLAWNAWQAATAAERERCAKVCEAICDVNWSIYKGYGENKAHPRRANTYMEGISDGAGQCANAVRKDEA